ncbi:hypothetical protein [Duganella radicis]|uniref:hypothetical protein n=1 Tax=Duganella radicis TaxID=551988 RepID=UPI001BABCD3D|nr:hypothetical protein [Duganella radicis]
MGLIHAPEYCTRLVEPSMPDVQPTSEIIVAGTNTQKFVAGAVFQAALRWNDYLLLFLTDDVIFEETLNIYLLDKDLNIVDLARMYHMYSTGVFSDLDLSEPDTVRFRFFEGLVWTLRLLNEQAFAVPFFSDPTGVHRPFKFFRRFHLHSHPTSGKSRSKISENADEKIFAPSDPQP